MKQDTLFPDCIETDRLRFERLCHDNVDLREFYRICSSDDAIEEVTEYVTWTPHETLKETRDYINVVEAGWNEGEAATYLIRPDETTEIAGAADLAVDWELRTGTLGIWLRKPYWGRGYSGERAAALIELAFQHLDLEIVSVTHDPDNQKSLQAVEKYIEAHGGQRDEILRNGLAHQDGTIVDVVHYSIAQHEYLEAVNS